MELTITNELQTPRQRQSGIYKENTRDNAVYKKSTGILDGGLPTFCDRHQVWLNLPATDAYRQHVADIEEKQILVPMDFFATPAITQESWKEMDYTMRRTICRVSTHGFHYEICSNKTFHEAIPDVCELCNQPCPTYHILYCTHRTFALHTLN